MGKAMDWWQDFLHLNNSPSQQDVHGAHARWSCPPSDRLKINVDGAWDKENCERSVGIIIKNDKGAFVGTATRVIMDVFSPIQVEALAMRVCLELVVERGLSKINIESDALQIISTAKESSVNVSPMGPIIKGIKFLLAMVAEASVAHVRRQANSVAHRLARFALHDGGNCTWFDESPVIINDLLMEDISLPCTK
ncbi:uncharacterized protein [Pyrus communis]|uniref:uncharacterized protein n=1 Tax=Pyrus communis TaxID=23211 RepID=UPI0035C18A3A